MNTGLHSMNKRLRLGAGTLAAGTVFGVLTACSMSNDGNGVAPSDVSPALTAASAEPASGPALAEWNKAISTARPPKTGCFQASYPSTDWVEVPCAPAPEGPVKLPRLRAPSTASQVPQGAASDLMAPFVASSPKSEDVGNGTDFFALLSGGGQITGAAGTFPSVSSGISLSTAYSIQMNTNVFDIAPTNSLCSGRSQCQGAQQVIYDGKTGGLFFEYVLMGGNCPNSNWASVGGNCYLGSTSVPNVPAVGISSLSTMFLAFTPNTPDGDYLAMTINGKAYYHYYPSVLGVNGWNSVQLGVYGEDDGLEAVFNSSNTSIVADITTSTTSGNVECSRSAGSSGYGTNESTVESNNLNLICCNAIAGGISFQQSSNPEQACAAGNALVASPNALTLSAGDGKYGSNTAHTDLIASGPWASGASSSSDTDDPGLTFPDGLPTGVTATTSEALDATTLLTFTAGLDATPGTYQVLVEGTVGTSVVDTYVTLTINACQPVGGCGNAVCGTYDNGCGETPSCGTCASGEICTNGECTGCVARSCEPGYYYNTSTCACDLCPCGGVKLGSTWGCKLCQ